MRKLRLEIDALRVDTDPLSRAFGTVNARSEAASWNRSPWRPNGFLSIITCSCGDTRCGASCVRTCDSCVGSPSCVTRCLGSCPNTGPIAPCCGWA